MILRVYIATGLKTRAVLIIRRCLCVCLAPRACPRAPRRGQSSSQMTAGSGKCVRHASFHECLCREQYVHSEKETPPSEQQLCSLQAERVLTMLCTRVHYELQYTPINKLRMPSTITSTLAAHSMCSSRAAEVLATSGESKRDAFLALGASTARRELACA